MNTEERERLFFIGLTKLTRETGIVIGGCGCCGSPYTDTLLKPDDLEEQAGYGRGRDKSVMWLCPSDREDWEKYGDSVVRAEPHD